MAARDGLADGPEAPFDASPSTDAGDAAGETGAEASVPPLGSMTNPAASCKALLAALPTTPAGGYWIAPQGATYNTYCDMTTEGGGWTKVTPTIPEAIVTLLRGGGAPGKQLFKCSNADTHHIESPSFTTDFAWQAPAMSVVSGTWTVDGASITCGSTNEYAANGCSKWFGVGCGNGSGNVDKLYPGVLGAAPSGDCRGSPAAHANGNFVICGTTNFLNYSIFVRAD